MTNTYDLETKIFDMNRKMIGLAIYHPKHELEYSTFRTERHLLGMDVLMIIHFHKEGKCDIGIYSNPLEITYMHESIPLSSYNPDFNRVNLLEAVRRFTKESGSQEMLSIIQSA